MTAIIRFTPVYGATEEQPLCYLLEVDDFKILLDCGWDPKFDLDVLKPLTKLVKRVDAVLISHPDIPHLGALPYAVGKLGLTAPVYATIPVYKMGQMFMYDAYQNRYSNEDFTLFNLDDVDAAFDKFVQLKYSQRVTFEGNGAGIEITAHPAGHLIGGSVWKIKKENEEIIYAVDYNHKKERHLSSVTLEALGRPTLLITDSYNALNSQASRKNRDNELLDTVMQILRGGGDVLIPVDTAGRVLELLIVLDQYWTNNKLGTYSLAFLSNVSFNTIEFAKSQLEWMNDTIMNAFNHSRENPFSFKHARLCHDREQLENLPTPRVVLASMHDLESGFAQELFVEYSEIKKNAVIFVDKPSPKTLAAQILQQQPPFKYTTSLKRRVPLEGEELEQHERKKREKEEAEALKRANAADDSGSESESDDELLLSKIPFQRSYDMTVDSFHNEGFKHPMFPYLEKINIYDEYGEGLVASDFIPDSDKKSITPMEEAKKGQNVVEMDVDTDAVPTKCIQVPTELKVNCVIKYIDFEGRSDGRSIKNILQHVAPRKLILIHGSSIATDHLRKFCESIKELKSATVFTPQNMENVHVTSDINIFKIKLSDTLMDTLEFQKVGDYELALVNGQVRIVDDGLDVPVLEKLPSDVMQEHKPAFIGEVKLYDLKPILMSAGYRADLQGGALVIMTPDGAPLSIRKDEVDGKAQLRLEGMMSEDYFRIRELLYSQFTII